MPDSDRLIKLLLVSQDQALRDAHNSPFRAAGYFVYTAGVQFLAISLRAAANFDVLVLDHTLSQQERRTVLYMAHTLAPQLLTVTTDPSGADCGADLVVDSGQGSKPMLSAIRELVENSRSKGTQK